MRIYKITNLLNGYIYIGQDKLDRNYYYGSGIRIKRALKKYGKKNFIKDILCYCFSIEELSEKEKYWIKYFKDLNYNLYNITKGGRGFQKKHTKESKEKIKKNNARYWLNKHHSEKTIEKIKKARAKQIITENTRRKMSTSLKKIIHNSEWNKKVSLNKRGKSNKLTKNDIKVIRYLYSTGKYFYKDIADTFNITASNVGCIIRKITWEHV